MKAKDLRLLSDGELIEKERQLKKNSSAFVFSMRRGNWRMSYGSSGEKGYRPVNSLKKALGGR
jgi:hypothetical protein